MYEKVNKGSFVSVVRKENPAQQLQIQKGEHESSSGWSSGMVELTTYSAFFPPSNEEVSAQGTMLKLSTRTAMMNVRIFCTAANIKFNYQTLVTKNVAGLHRFSTKNIGIPVQALFNDAFGGCDVKNQLHDDLSVYVRPDDGY